MSTKNDTEKSAELKEAIRAQMEFSKPIATGYNSQSMDDYREKKGELDISQENEILPEDYGYLGQANIGNAFLNDPDYIKWLEKESRS